MLERLRNNKNDDQGFTLIELLVVMIIIGILAAIAIPVFLSQREKAQDTAARADAKTIGTEISTYFVDSINVTGLGLAIDANGRYALTGGDLTAAQDLGNASPGNTVGGQWFASPTSWCVTIINPEGDISAVGVSISYADGAQDTVCPAAPVAPVA